MDEFVVGCMLYNIVICDDNLNDLNIITEKISNYFDQQKNIYFKIYSFNDYNNKFIDFIYNNRLTNLIYLLDIETPSGDGFDIARTIKRFDANIPIIYITGHHEKHINKALKSCDMDGYINKFNNLENELIEKFDKILAEKGKKYIFHIKGNNVTYILNVKNINCFTTDIDRKNQIRIIGNYYPNIHLSIRSLYIQLDSRFIKTHQSCIVNLDNVKEFDIKNKIIYFKDKSHTDLISRNFFKKNKEWLLEHYSDKIIFK